MACDKFKGSLTASQVMAAVTGGLRDVAPAVDVRSTLVADGGDGTLEAVRSAGFTLLPVTVTGPTGRPVDTHYATNGDTAVVEMADACGLVRLPGGELAPLTASSRGLGEVVGAVLDAGIRRIVIGVGGSASTDGGAGMLNALGARLLDDAGRDLRDGGGALSELATVDLTGLHPGLAQAELTLASDVDNPLLGHRGAVAVFSAQKGAGWREQQLLERGLSRLAEVLTDHTGGDAAGLAGAGAAGGVGFAAQALLGARFQSGIEFLLQVIGFDEVVAGAALVVTGEGYLDRQTLSGKTPFGVATAARVAGAPVVAVCGGSDLDDADLADIGIKQVFRLSDLEPDLERCMSAAGPLLRQAARLVARRWLHPMS